MTCAQKPHKTRQDALGRGFKPHYCVHHERKPAPRTASDGAGFYNKSGLTSEIDMTPAEKDNVQKSHDLEQRIMDDWAWLQQRLRAVPSSQPGRRWNIWREWFEKWDGELSFVGEVRGWRSA